MLTSLLLYALILTNIPGRVSAKVEEYYASIQRLEQCPGMDDLLLKVHTLYMNYQGNNTYTMTFNMTLEEDISEPLDMKFEAMKCASEHGPCEDYGKHTIENVCDELKTEGSIPRILFERAKLPLKCPIPKGSYMVEKSEIKIPSELLEVGRDANYWKVKNYLMKGPKVPVSCIYSEGKVARVSKMKKKKRKQ